MGPDYRSRQTYDNAHTDDSNKNKHKYNRYEHHDVDNGYRHHSYGDDIK